MLKIASPKIKYHSHEFTIKFIFNCTQITRQQRVCIRLFFLVTATNNADPCCLPRDNSTVVVKEGPGRFFVQGLHRPQQPRYTGLGAYQRLWTTHLCPNGTRMQNDCQDSVRLQINGQ